MHLIAMDAVTEEKLRKKDKNVAFEYFLLYK